MANRYWVGGTAAWDGTAGTKWALTSGGAGGQAIPTTADDVFFDGSSGAGTVTISTGNTGAGSINCTGFTGTIAGSAGITVAGNFTLVSAMAWSATSRLLFTGASSAGTYTITTAGKTITVGGGSNSAISVGTWQLGDALTLTGSAGGLTVSGATTTFNTNNYNVTIGTDFVFSSGAVNLGSSTVTLTGNTGFNVTAAGTTFNAGTSNIVLSGAVSPTNGITGGKTYYNVSFTNTAITSIPITGANTFNNLSISGRTSSGIAAVTFDSNQTINGTLTLSAGTNVTCRTFLASSSIGSARTITYGAISSLTDIDFRDVVLSGPGTPLSGTRLGDCKGNSGITFDAAKTVYWNLAGAQSWSATGWATSSGGSPSVNNFPLAQDTAVFDNTGSVTGTITINAAWNIGTLDMSARTSAMTLSTGSNAPSIYGNWTNGSGTTLSGTGQITFAGRGSQSITSAAKTFSQTININSPSGTVSLNDALASSNGITVTNGTFNAVSYNVTAANFSSNNSNTRTISMGSGTWTLSGTGTVWDTAATTGLTFNKGTANIVLSNTTTFARTFAGGGLTYNKLTIGGATGTSALTIQGSNTFSEIDSTKTVAHTITLTNGTTTTVTTWSVKGTAGNVVTLQSPVAGSSYTLAKAGGGFLTGIDYLNVRDAIGSPISDTWYIGANSVINTTAPNTGRALFTTQRADNAIVVLTSTSSTSWTVPTDWNNSSNTIHLIGGGGGGGGGRVSGSNRAGGGGGGGAGYTKLINQTLSGSVTYQAGTAGGGGAAGADGTAGGTTSWNSGASTAGGGGGGQATTTPTSTGGTAGTGSTFNGGVGGAGSTATSVSNGNGGGGGGGAAGPNGAGANGGIGFTSTTSGNVAGGGGGGNGGGTAGGNASSATGGTGGNNSSSVGGGASNTSGAVGGGGGGSVSASSVGGNGIDVFGIGSGGGGGGGANATQINTGGLYGGGGGGGGVSTGGTTRAGTSGSQGVIIIVYTPSAGGIVNGESNISVSAVLTSAGSIEYSASSAISCSAILSAISNELLEGIASVFCNATTSASGVVTLIGNAGISCAAITQITATRTTFSGSSISCSAVFTSAGLLEKIGYADINGVATATATASYLAGGAASAECFATVIPLGNTTFSAGSTLSGFATLTPNGRIVGDEWSTVSPGSNTWTDVGAGSNTWTEVQSGENTWLRQG